MRLARQLSLLVIAMLMAATMLITLSITHVYRQAYQDEVREHGSGLHLLLAETLAEYVIQGRVLEIEQLLKQAQRAEPKITYLYLTDFDGRLIAHTFAQGFPRALLPTLKTGLASRTHSRMRTREFSIEHYSAPLIEGMSARFHLGLPFTHKKHLNKMYRLLHASRHEHTKPNQTEAVHSDRHRIHQALA